VALIFISYRRADAGKTAWRLFDWLERQFGAEGVFFDREGIEPGEAFPQVLEQQLNECQVLIALIGPRWLDIADDQGKPRLWAAHDYVAHEVATALKRGIRVVPVLVDGATMPAADQLPPALAAFADNQALAIDDAHFATDFERLVDALEGRPRGWRERERDRARRFGRYLQRTSLVVPVLVPLVFLAAWVDLFNLFGIDTQVASYTLLLSDQSTPVYREERVVVVALDQATEQQLGRSYDGDPAEASRWRADHARLIDRLSAAGAATIALDFYFERQTEADPILADAVRRAAAHGTRVVFGARSVKDGHPVLVPALAAASRPWGVLCIGRKNGYLFTTPLARTQRPPAPAAPGDCEPAELPAFALAAAFDARPADVCATDRRITLVTGGADPGAVAPLRHLPFAELQRMRTTPARCPALDQGDHVATSLMVLSPTAYWRQPPGGYSYGQMLGPPGGGALPDLRGKTVLVGVTVDAPGDIHTERHGPVAKERYGVELQADAVRNLLSGFSLQPVTMPVQFGLILALALLGAITRFATARWRPALRFALALAMTTAYLAAGVVLSSSGILLNPMYDVVAFVMAFRILGRLEARADGAMVTGANR
jgi:hypothetical protein